MVGFPFGCSLLVGPCEGSPDGVTFLGPMWGSHYMGVPYLRYL
jgi:hypothetical protein